MPTGLGTILGAAQAEADEAMLGRAFLETADYQALLHTSDFNYVVGRRGTGKSALFLRLRETLQQDSGVILLVEQPQDFEMVELQALLRALSSEYRLLRPITRLLWTVHLLLETAKGVAKHYRFAKSLHVLYLADYIQRQSIGGGTGTGHCVRRLTALVKSGATPDQIPRLIAAEFETTELTEALREALVQTGLRVVALYDRLDEAWVPEVQPIAILGGLAKAAADHRERQLPLYPVLFVRDNMFRALAKIDDDFTRHVEGHTLRLHWDEESLFHLIAARLRVALGLESVESEVRVWDRFAHRELQGRAGFQRCLRHTLYRPRDILVLLNSAYANAHRGGRHEIVDKDVEKSATEISQHRLEDLCKEYDRVLPGLRSFIQAFRGQPAHRPLADVARGLQALATNTDYSDAAAGEFELFQSGGDMFAALYSVGFVGLKDDATGGYSFCHDGTMVALASVAGDKETLVHPCYWKALEVNIDVGDASEPVIQVNDEYVAPPTNHAIDLRLQRLGRLPEELSGVPEGQEGCRTFEAWVLRAVRLLCSGHLANIELKPNPVAALNQRDIVGTNATTSAFWRRIHDDYQTRQVVFECKNYQELTTDDFRQVLDYSSGEYGRFSIVVRRGPSEHLTPLEQDRTRAMFYEHKRVILVLPVALISLCIRKLRTPKKYDYTEFILSKHMDYVVRSVLSLTHTPRYKTKRRR